jgi:hypothetical protein
VGFQSLFFLLHRAPAALYGASTSFGDDHLRAALATDIDFTKLISHFLPRSGNSSCQCEARRSAKLSKKLNTFEDRFSLFQKSPHAFGPIGRGL